MFLDRFKSILLDPPPAMAFEISHGGIAAARIAAHTEIEFQPLKAGAITGLAVSGKMCSIRRASSRRCAR